MKASAIGLTETELNVYKALLRMGSSLAADVIKSAQIHRATAYDVLNRLMEKGLAGYIIKNKKKYYNAATPGRIIEIFEEKKKKLETEEEEIKKSVKELEQIRLLEKKKDIAQIYSGKEGLKAVMQDILADGMDFMVIGGEVKFSDVLPIYTKHWAEAREKKGIYAKILTAKAKKSNWKYNSLKHLPEEYNFPSPTIIYGNKVAVILYEEPITIVSIESRQIADTYMGHFNLLWKTVSKN
ncbi:MAG TPA: TrmB family transcriptional regulator [Nanoarchaeota archaeon]|nr:TrmB family transcriptional regulator [Nanoarchaeota archaeon]